MDVGRNKNSKHYGQTFTRKGRRVENDKRAQEDLYFFNRASLIPDILKDKYNIVKLFFG